MWEICFNHKNNRYYLVNTDTGQKVIVPRITEQERERERYQNEYQKAYVKCAYQNSETVYHTRHVSGVPYSYKMQRRDARQDKECKVKYATLVREVDTKYKDGFVECACGWHKSLGDGFNQHYISVCPKCTPELETRVQRKVVYWDKDERSLRADIGTNIYFVIKDCIHVRYSFTGTTTLGSEKKLEAL